ncbi:MBL fold metallo-hydrolase [Geopseudomonas guangdongensis]|uniref:Glyoxylase, beta-lactamase superfamily II n=1 Tax=Geopseudomonas guangdongensis TaxID=1245526 RepID=A0A1H2HRW6_9GAMM|nr:MBL fold metallo-hydrolase [Pseudomonas guangdongensis]SDU34587.1 Glyoxylase, beta-lactamase superfamily II [Pseudomonas guangdongensis]
MNAHVEAFFDPATFTYSYVVSDPTSGQCALVDPVLDYDPAAGRTSHKNADRLIAYVREHGLRVQWILETHVHADHLSAGHYLKEQLGGTLAIGDRITVVQDTFGKLFNVEPEFATDGRQFDRLFKDGETFRVGSVEARAIHTPGHTPACMTYLIGDAAFVGDTLFMPDYGTARCDFPGGDARTLYRSIHTKLFALPDATRVFMCHDYKAPGRDQYLYETTIGAERTGNVHIHVGIGEEQFVAMRQARDATLGMPTLILPSVQINMRAGELPPAEDNGTRYLKIPLDLL